MCAGLRAGPISLSPHARPWLMPCVSPTSVAPAIRLRTHMALPTVTGPCLPPCPLRPACSRPGSFPPELRPVKAESLAGMGSVSVCRVRHPQKLGHTRGFVLCLHLVFYFWIWSHQVWRAVRKVEVRAELGYTGMRPQPHRQRCQDVQTALCCGSGSRCTGDLGAGNPSRVSS